MIHVMATPGKRLTVSAHAVSDPVANPAVLVQPVAPASPIAVSVFAVML